MNKGKEQKARMKLPNPKSRDAFCPIVFCDFDGTITLSDVTDEILNRLAAPGWVEIEQMWTQGVIGSKECLERQLALVRTSAADLNALIDSVPVDPCFGDFVRFVREKSVPFIVVSDGLDYVIRRILKRFGIRGRVRNGIQFFSTSVRLKPHGLSVSFPHALSSCTHGCATCKPLVIRALKGAHSPVLYIGDGLSDRHAVIEADFVYARRPLLDHCQTSRIPSFLFNTFGEIQDALAGWWEGRDSGLGIRDLRARRSESEVRDSPSKVPAATEPDQDLALAPQGERAARRAG
jgi:2-hydroxy-3-keto-5-methylthiopentenyl-1-phosphate phosphatase